MNSFLPELLNYCLGKRGIAKEDIMESGSKELLKRMRVERSRVRSGWYTGCIPNKVAYLLATEETGVDKAVYAVKSQLRDPVLRCVKSNFSILSITDQMNIYKSFDLIKFQGI